MALEIPQELIDNYLKNANELAQKASLFKVEAIPEDLLKAITEQKVNGAGAFDWLATSLLVHLNEARRSNLLTQQDIATVYSNALPEFLRISTDFLIQKERFKLESIQLGLNGLKSQAEIAKLPLDAYALLAQLQKAIKELELAENKLKASYAEYMDTIDGQPIGGTLGAQIEVNKQQAKAIEKSSFQQFLSHLKEGWTTKKNSDIGTLSPDVFTAYGVNQLYKEYVKQFINQDGSLMAIPSGYRDYLTSEEMSGTKSTPSVDNAKA